MKKIKNQGITLIALVVTIVVLLILAGTSIAMLTGDNGIIRQAQESNEENKKSEVEEQVRLAVMSAKISGLGTIDYNILNNELDKIGYTGEDITSFPAEVIIDGITVKINKDQSTEIKTGDSENNIVIEEPETYEKYFQAGDDIKAYLVENTEVEGESAYDLLFTGTGIMWPLSSWINEVGQFVDAGYYGTWYEWNYSIKDVTISYGITNIANSAFSDCQTLESIIIPESVTSIGIDAFYGCDSLTDVIIPESVTNIEIGAFNGCTGLTNLVILAEITNIASYSFSACSSLTSIVIPEGVTFIEGHAFYGCSNLTNITISVSVTTIQSNAFYNYSTDILISVNYTGTEEQWKEIAIDSYGNTNLLNAKINYNYAE